MDRKERRRKRLLSILTAMAIFITAFAGIIPVSAEDLEAISADAVTAAILKDNTASVDSLYTDYSISKTQDGNTITVEITTTDLKKHKNGAETPKEGYWTGFAVEAPEGAEKMKYAFGATDSIELGDSTVAVETIADEKTGIAFYINAGEATPKKYAKLQWFDAEDNAVSAETNFVIDISAVTLSINDDTPVAVTTAIIADSEDAGRSVHNEAEYKAELQEDGRTVKVTMKKLALHKNGNGDEGFWTGFAVAAPDGAGFVKYSFGETVDEYIPVETAVATVGETATDGIAFYTDAANPNTDVKLQWFDEENIALSNPVELTMNLEDVEYYQINAEDVTEAVLKDTSETPKETLYTDYSVEAVTNDGTIAVTVTAADLVKHKNGAETPKEGYWTGFAVRAPENAKKAKGIFGGDSYDADVVVIDDDNTGGIAFYINAGAEIPKANATLQWLDENGKTLSAVTEFEIVLDATLDVIDYTPEVVKANIADYDEEREVYDTDSYTVDAETTPGVVAVSMTGLKEHTRASLPGDEPGDEEGYWTGFAVKAPAGAEKFRYAFGADKETLVWEAGLHAVEDIDAINTKGAAFIADANAAQPKKFVKLQWFDNEGNAVTDAIELEMNLDGVKLNWISQKTVELAPSTGTAPVTFDKEQTDGVITVKYTAENLDKHANGDTPAEDGYWVGFAVEAPTPEAKANVTFGDYSNPSMELEDINAEKKGITFYTNAGNANPKTEAALQWIDAAGSPISAPTTFVIDISGVTLAELPYIIADDVKEANIVDQSNTSVKPYSSYSVSAEADENGVIVVDIDMKSLKSHKNGEDKSGHWTGFSVAVPDNAAQLRYAFAADKEALSSMTTAAVGDDEEVSFYANTADESPKKYVRLQWFDENGDAITNATDFEMDLSGVKHYSKSGGSSGGGSSNYCTVTFQSNGGSTVASVKAKKEEAISEPTAPVKDGYTFDGWYTDKELTKEYDFSSAVTKSFTLYAKWTEKTISFIDVDKDAWYYDIVAEAVKKGLMNGISETEFAPELPVTRAMFVTVLYRAAGQPKAETESAFADVAANQYYTDAVAWANASGIVNGISETEFAPDLNITREQMAAILYRYAQASDTDLTAEGEITYTDKDSISDYAAEAIVWAESAGIMEGNADGTFAPLRNASRAEAAAVFVRLLKVLK